jgi:hypothetical protein
MPRISGMRETSRLNVYDRFTLGEGGENTYYGDLELGNNEIRLFGNRNIGYLAHTNLQVPQTLVCDQTMFLEHWYARTDLLGEALSLRQRADLHAWASSAMVTLVLGDRPRNGWTRPLSELLADRPWVPASVLESEHTPEELEVLKAAFLKRIEEGMRPVCVPVRQTVSIQIGAYDHEAFSRLVASMDGRTIKFWLHLEGIVRRDIG